MFIIITIHGPFHQSTRCLYMFLQRSLSIMDFWYQRSFRLDLGVRSLHCEPDARAKRGGGGAQASRDYQSMELIGRKWWRLISTYQIYKQFSYALSLLLWDFINTTTYHLGWHKPSFPPAKEVHGQSHFDYLLVSLGTPAPFLTPPLNMYDL